MKRADLGLLSFKKYPCQLVLSLIISILSGGLFLINRVYLNYPGNNYFPTQFIPACIILVAISSAVHYCVINNYIRRLVFSIFSLFFMMSIVALATNAVQFTPFPPIDSYIIASEGALNFNLAAVIAWTNHHLTFKYLLELAYASLAYQIAIIPILIAVFDEPSKVREYICLFLISTLIGFAIYYFFPTMAPSGLISSPYFSDEQLATSLKFRQIHQYINPTTLAGGMIALPSFHTIWAWFSVFLVREYSILLLILVPINSVLVLACVLLGWHYPLDIIVSGIVILLSHGLYRFCSFHQA